MLRCLFRPLLLDQVRGLNGYKYGMYCCTIHIPLLLILIVVNKHPGSRYENISKYSHSCRVYDLNVPYGSSGGVCVELPGVLVHTAVPRVGVFQRILSRHTPIYVQQYLVPGIPTIVRVW